MLRRLFISLFLFQTVLIFPQTPSAGFSIGKIVIEGGRIFSETDYLRAVSLPPTTPLFPGARDTISARIFRFLHKEGFYKSEVSVDSALMIDTAQVLFTVTVNENDAAVTGTVEINGIDSSEADLVREEFSYLSGNRFLASEVEQAVQFRLDKYEEEGFPFAQVKIESLFFIDDTVENEHRIDIRLLISKGRFSTIDSVQIVGNTDTDYDVIVREIRLQRGEPYRYSVIREIPERLNRLRFFDPVPEPGYFIGENDAGILKITVKEKSTNNFDGILGYIPGTKEESGYLTGLVNLSMRNLFGTGRAAALRWQQIDRYSQLLEFKYFEPYIFGLPFSLGGSLFQQKQDTTYVQRKLEGSVEYKASGTLTLSLFVANESTIPTIGDVPRFSVFNASLFTTGAGVTFDSRDDPYAPTFGFLFNSTFGYTQKTINGPKEFTTSSTKTSVQLKRVTADAGIYYEFFSKQVAAVTVHGRDLTGELLEISDYFKFGGTNTLRGYRENQFFGQRLFWTNAEYRFLLSRRTYAFLFYDIGYYFRKADEEKQTAEQSMWKSAYGLGLNLETGIGILGVSFAIAEGTSFSKGLIHFGIINEF